MLKTLAASSRRTCLVVAVLLAPLSPVRSQEAAGKAEDEQKTETEFTLENIFPDKKTPLFGPGARSPKFSSDGKYAAWLHKSYDERRHGNDLFVLDVATQEVRRLTSATLMAGFQSSARKAVEDREKKAKAEDAKDKDKDKKDGEDEKKKGEQDGEDEKKSGKKLGDRVGKKDYDDEKAPRYSGISDFEWAPNAAEMLFSSESDIYRVSIGDDNPERLTRTSANERDVQFLPDGSGYTYMIDGALMKVVFGSHLITQIDPKLPSGERMSGYELSPDGKKLVFLARKGSSSRSGGRTVNIARYRERFMEVREVSRHVSDDPISKSETMVYLHDLAGALQEEGDPVRLYKHEVSGPRDSLPVPEWAPDSSRVTFAVFEQTSDQVVILEGKFPEEKEAEDEADEEGEKDGDETDEEKDDGSKDENVANDDEAKKGDAEEGYVDAPASVVYRFLHHGGPNTPRMMEPQYLADSRRIIFLSEQTGFRHVHLLDPLYESQRPLTFGRYEVYPFDISKDHANLFVTATKEHPTRQDIYRLDLLSGEMTRLTHESGVYSGVAVHPNGQEALATFVSYGALRELVHVDARGQQKAVTDSHPEATRELTAMAPEFFSYENRHGHEIHGFAFKPPEWSKADKRPMLLYVYGGPLGTRKQVTAGNYHSASYFFAQYMAREHGYVTCTIDPRGMSGYGGVFEKANFEQVGKPQVEDLADGVAHMVEHYGVDPEKVSMHGWSFGGFQTQMCMYTEPDVFKVGIAGAGPTEWENYNSWYSTGTIGKSRTGKPDLEKYSLLPLAKNLEGKLLLVHGMEDSNVLYQDTVRVYRELLKADKETLVELFLDPTGGHGLGGDVTTLRRYRKYEEFLVRNLGEGAAAELPEAIGGEAEAAPPVAAPARRRVQ